MQPPTLTEIQSTRNQIDQYIVETPVWQWNNRELHATITSETKVFLKLELFQHTGTFKPRGALSNILNLEPAQLKKGVTAFSAGNHAIAVSYAAAIAGTSAKVAMPKTANPIRIANCRAYGAEIELLEDVHAAGKRVLEIEEEEGRYYVKPFEGPATVRGTATLGLELAEQVPDLEAVIVPIGGGGLCAGIATAFKLLQPQCKVYGVEPEGADAMHRSFASGKTESIDKVRTIADSLGAPYTTPYTLAVCQKYIDELVMIDDDQIRAAMRQLFHGMKLAVEPAGAAAAAALNGPLRDRLTGKRVALIASGTNIDLSTFAKQTQNEDA